MGSSWAIDTKHFADTAVKVDFATVARKTLFEVYEGVTTRTPVGEYDNGTTGGFLRSNWQVGDGTKPSGTIGIPGEKQDHNSKVAIGSRKALSWNINNDLWIVNNAAYAGVVENGLYPNPPKKGSYVKGQGYVIKSSGGYSKKAPQGMLKVALRSFQYIIEREAKKI